MSITTIEDNPELDSIILKADLSETKEEQLGQVRLKFGHLTLSLKLTYDI